MKIKQLVLSITIIFACALTFAPALTFAADPCDTNGDGVVNTQEAIQCGTNGASGSAQTPAEASKTVNTTIQKAINLLSVAVGVVAVIMIILGGFRYITSGGTTEKVASAKNTLLYAVVGLVIVALAQVIARFVLNKVA